MHQNTAVDMVVDMVVDHEKFPTRTLVTIDWAVLIRVCTLIMKPYHYRGFIL